jgi:formiminotetrahydrofolate cyclodeaminase
VPDPQPTLLDLTVRELLDAVADRTPAPGGGGVAALVTAMAAGLAGMAARFGDGTGADAADALRVRAMPLADADAAAYRAFLDATRLPREDPSRAGAVEAARRDAIAVPAEIAEIAGAVAELAAGLARTGNRNLHGDAAAAVHLAAAAAGTTVELLAANVAGDTGTRELARARATAATARDLAATVGRR